MSKNCTKKQHQKNREIAIAGTKLRKQIRLYRTAVKQENNLQAMDAFIQSVHPERVTNWLNRIKP